jgi:hypothetical protein
MNLKNLERYLRVNLLGPGPRLIKNNLPGCGLTKVEKHCLKQICLQCRLAYRAAQRKSDASVSTFYFLPPGHQEL